MCSLKRELINMLFVSFQETLNPTSSWKGLIVDRGLALKGVICQPFPLCFNLWLFSWRWFEQFRRFGNDRGICFINRYHYPTMFKAGVDIITPMLITCGSPCIFYCFLFVCLFALCLFSPVGLPVTLGLVCLFAFLWDHKSHLMLS